jgi:hypothetical protein
MLMIGYLQQQRQQVGQALGFQASAVMPVDLQQPPELGGGGGGDRTASRRTPHLQQGAAAGAGTLAQQQQRQQQQQQQQQRQRQQQRQQQQQQEQQARRAQPVPGGARQVPAGHANSRSMVIPSPSGRSPGAGAAGGSSSHSRRRMLSSSHRTSLSHTPKLPSIQENQLLGEDECASDGSQHLQPAEGPSYAAYVGLGQQGLQPQLPALAAAGSHLSKSEAASIIHQALLQNEQLLVAAAAAASPGTVHQIVMGGFLGSGAAGGQGGLAGSRQAREQGQPFQLPAQSPGALGSSAPGRPRQAGSRGRPQGLLQRALMSQKSISSSGSGEAEAEHAAAASAASGARQGAAGAAAGSVAGALLQQRQPAPVSTGDGTGGTAPGAAYMPVPVAGGRWAAMPGGKPGQYGARRVSGEGDSLLAGTSWNNTNLSSSFLQ